MSVAFFVNTSKPDLKSARRSKWQRFDGNLNVVTHLTAKNQPTRAKEPMRKQKLCFPNNLKNFSDDRIFVCQKTSKYERKLVILGFFLWKLKMLLLLRPEDVKVFACDELTCIRRCGGNNKNISEIRVNFVVRIILFGRDMYVTGGCHFNTVLQRRSNSQRVRNVTVLRIFITF